MTCELCKHRPGWSGFARITPSGIVDVPCRCVTDRNVRDIYGHPRNRTAMLQAIRDTAP